MTEAFVVIRGIGSLNGNNNGCGYLERIITTPDGKRWARVRLSDGRYTYPREDELSEVIWRYGDKWPPPLQGESE